MSGSVFARDDTMFGVCEALGEDFGFNPNLLRVLFGIGLFWGPVTAIAAYAAAGALVSASRWLVPNPPLVGRERAEACAANEANDQAATCEAMALAA